MKKNNRNIKQSIYWNYTSSVAIHSIALFTSAILLKLLSPTDFGILAILFLVLGIGSIFIGQGYITAIIREKNLNNTILSTVFWINISFGITVVILSYLLGDILGHYFEIENFKDYLFCFSLAYFLQSVNVVPLALLERNLNFKRHSIIHIYATVIAAFIVILLALNNFGVYSLIWRGLSAGIVVTVFLWYRSDWKPSIIFDYNSLKPMHRFSRGVLGTQVLRYAANQLDNLMVIKLLGTSDLGIYNRAKTFVQKPAREINIKTRSVAYSALSKIEDPIIYRKTLFKFTLLLSLIIVPLLLIVLISSDTLIHRYLSEEWYPMIDILKLLAISSIIISTSMPSQILLSKGASDTLFKSELITNFIKIIILLFAFKYADLLTIVALFSMGQILSSLLQNVLAYRTVKGYKSMIWKYHILPIIMAFLVYSFAVLIDRFVNINMASLISKLIICLSIYGIYAWKTYPEIVKSLRG